MVDLTAEQQAVAAHPARRLRVTGEAGTGKTTTLLARFRQIARSPAPSRLALVCRNQGAAARALGSLLPHLQGSFDSLPVTTFAGLARDILTCLQVPIPPVVAGPDHAALVRRLLVAEPPAAWGRFGPFLARPAFAAAVGAAVAEARARAREGLPSGNGWPPELVSFADRYEFALHDGGMVDRPGLLQAAARAVHTGGASHLTHLLVDDFEAATGAEADLVAALAGTGIGLTVASNPSAAFGSDRGADPAHARELAVDTDAALTRSFRQPPHEGRLLVCSHPSAEPEAVAAELASSREQGVAWSDMAVLLRQPRRGVQAIARALARHGIPAAPARAPAQEPARKPAQEPATAAAVAALRQAVPGAAREAGRARTAAELAYGLWASALEAGTGQMDEAALDAWVALVARLARLDHLLPAEALAALEAEERAGTLPSLAASADRDPRGTGVTITSVGAAAGREWHTVVVAGCVEGDMPHLSRGRSVLSGPPTPDTRRAALDEERRLFGVAASRATGRMVATAAPRPGVLVSRFVEGWPPLDRAGRLPAPGPPALVRSPTVNPVPVTPGGRLTLSASQLDTYEDCPLRYSFEYPLRARGDAGVRADLGSLVHEVLAAFLDPAADDRPPRTRDALMALAAERWREDIARWRPQVEEARRDYYEMLAGWWEAEGDPGSGSSPEVLAVEKRFDVEVGPHRLTGAIDRVDRGPDGGIRVVDYKTGRSELSAAEVAANLQLSVYHLAAGLDPDLAALGPPTQLRMRFLRSMNAIDQPVTEGHGQGTEARVLATAGLILDESFEPSVCTTSCRYCDFHRLCPLQPEGRQVGCER